MYTNQNMLVKRNETETDVQHVQMETYVPNIQMQAMTMKMANTIRYRMHIYDDHTFMHIAQFH